MLLLRFSSELTACQQLWAFVNQRQLLLPALSISVLIIWFANTRTLTFTTCASKGESCRMFPHCLAVERAAMYCLCTYIFVLWHINRTLYLTVVRLAPSEFVLLSFSFNVSHFPCHTKVFTPPFVLMRVHLFQDCTMQWNTGYYQRALSLGGNMDLLNLPQIFVVLKGELMLCYHLLMAMPSGSSNASFV